MSLCDILVKVVAPSKRLLLYLRKIKRDSLDIICRESYFSLDEVVNTRCGTSALVARYLLSSINKRQVPYILPTKLSEVVLEGVDENGDETGLGHTFDVVYNASHGDEWLIFDSYIGCREFSCRSIDIGTLMVNLSQLIDKYDKDIWEEVTGCRDKYFSADKVKVRIYSYDCIYDPDEIISRFRDLIAQAEMSIDVGYVGDFDFLPISNVDELRGYLVALEDTIIPR